MNKLKKIRLDNRYTQTQAAKASGVSRQAYARYEAGEVDPPLSVLQNLAAFYNVSLESLVSSKKSVLYSITPKNEKSLSVNEFSGLVSYGDSMYGIVSRAIETMSLSKLRQIHSKISAILSVSEASKMSLEDFEKYAVSCPLQPDGQEIVNMLRSGDREF